MSRGGVRWANRWRLAGCFFLVGWLVALVGPTAKAAVPARGPNIVLILADDLGYGDLGCYGSVAIPTPHMDRLAREGLRFTDAHAAAATCTPSRYALLTGEYAWRRKGTGVLPGDAALVLTPGRLTLASMLQRAGYATGVVGKWHLGLGTTNLDWNTEIRPGPRDVGFAESFIMAATGDRVPCVYLENQRVVGLDPADPIHVSYGKPIGDEPTGKSRPDLLRMPPSHGHDQTIVNGISRIGYMTGGMKARWKDEEMSDRFVAEARKFIERHRREPFFLYFALHDPHVPRVPHPRFVGRTALGPRGDAIVQADAAVGEILGLLDAQGLAANTLVILTSDNGAVVDDGYRDGAVVRLGKHRPSGPWRGGKYSAFEGGTRVPFLARWPARIQPGVSDALVSQVDFVASVAALLGLSLDPGVAPDSHNVLPALLGQDPGGRDHLVEQAGVLSLREGAWKYIEPGRGPARLALTDTETGQDPGGLLFHLTDDPGESRNRIAEEPERAARMQARLAKIRADGRSRP